MSHDGHGGHMPPPPGDHGGHGGHNMPMPDGPSCSMNMLWNTQIEDTCIVFRQWHISSTTTFILSLIVVAGFGVLYEWMRSVQTGLDVRVARELKRANKGKNRSRPNSPEREEGVGLLTGQRLVRNGVAVPPVSRLLRAGMYGSTVFLSFFIMLIFMTYNAYLIIAVVVGAAVGHYIFNPEMDYESVLAGHGANAKGVACH